MTDAVWFAATLLFIVFGFSSRTLDLPARLAVRYATGTVIGGAVMWTLYLAHVPWSRAALLVAMLVAFVLQWFARKRGGEPTHSKGLWPIAVVALLATYAALDARETNADLLYFWGPKAQQFFLTRGIDVDFLRLPFHILMHSDYPPLQPMVLAWSSIAAHRFSAWGALLLTPLCLVAAALALRGYSRSNAFSVLLAALLAFTFASSYVAGGADAELILFEVMALSALTFADDANLVAAVALAGAAFTKVEGAAFAAVVIVAYGVVRRGLRRVAILSAPSVVLLGSWILFARHEHILDSYALGGKPLFLPQLSRVLPVALHEASYRAMYLPWIAVGVPLAIGRRWRRAALPLLVAAGSIAYAIFFYLHVPDPTFWVQSSANRVLITPLVCLTVAAAATTE